MELSLTLDEAQIKIGDTVKNPEGEGYVDVVDEEFKSNPRIHRFGLLIPGRDQPRYYFKDELLKTKGHGI